MAENLQGTRPRPRVALLGEFDPDIIENLTKLFPTLWIGEDALEIDPRELDLAIISPSFIGDTPRWLHQVHLIAFSKELFYLPSPLSQFFMTLGLSTSTEEYILPDLPLNFERLREVDFSHLTSTKGWKLIKLTSNIVSDATKKANKEMLDGALIVDRHTKLPFASIFIREVTGLGVAWLPNEAFRIVPWVELICSEWAKHDNIRFPNFGDWTKNSQWMLPEEEDLVQQIDNLINEKKNISNEYNQKIGRLQENLIEKSAQINKGSRLLITSQGDELVGEVSKALSKLGFIVNKMDESISEGAQKLEDLRINDPNVKDWEAIVEVRGYSKSGGRTDDLSRLARFARRYEVENGKAPQKRIYIINGQIDLPPSQRQSPLVSAPEDVKEFAEQEGIIIWSLDLFQAIKTLKGKDLSLIRKSIMSAKGRWPN